MRKRFDDKLLFLLFSFLPILLSGILLSCGDAQFNESKSFGNTSSASFSVVWHDAPSQVETDYSPQAVTCEDAGISTISCSIYDSSDTLVKSAGPWDCSPPGATIRDIPVGSNYCFVVLGRDLNGQINHRGETCGITISKDQIEDVGEIDVYPFKPVLTSPASGAEVDQSTVQLVWESVTGADEYRVALSENENMSEPFEEDTVLEPPYEPQNVPLDVVCYWQVTAIDVPDIERASDVWNFTGLYQWYRDADEDGYGNPDDSSLSATQPSGYISDNSDCDDDDINEFPGQTWYHDSDSDTFGDNADPQTACEQPADHVLDNTDCDDSDANEYPNQTWYLDGDGDSYSDGTTNTESCERPVDYYLASELTATSGDCNDDNLNINPGAIEIPSDGIDQNCDGSDQLLGPIAFYPFNGNANDDSGNGNNGTVNGATLTTDRFGNANSAYSFDGIDDFIEIQDSQSLDISGPISISAWVKPNNSQYWRSGIVTKLDNSVTPHIGYALRLTAIGDDQNDQRGWFSLYEDTGYSTTTNQSINDDIWHHLATIYDGQTMRLYLDGILQSTEVNTAGCHTNDSPLFIGKQIYPWHDGHELRPDQVFNGAIDEVRIYNRALSEAEIQSLYGSFEKILYTSTASGYNEIWMMNSDGSEKTQITSLNTPAGHPPTNLHPSSSPDGRKISFASSRDTGGENWELFFMDLESLDVKKLVNESDVEYVDIRRSRWSKDGSKILFTAGSGTSQGRIYEINTNGTGLTNLHSDLFLHDADWCPLENEIAYNQRASTSTESGQLWIMDADGTNNVHHFGEGTGHETTVASVDWGPHGIIAISYGSDLWLYDPSDGSATALTTDGVWPVQGYSDPSWSSDGRYLAYGFSNAESAQIWIMNVDSGESTLIATASSGEIRNPTFGFINENIIGNLSLPLTKNLNNPVLDVGGVGEWDSNFIGHPSVLYIGGTYHMWYAGNDGTDHRIGYVTSSDGITWTKYANNPVLQNGNSGEWDYALGSPSVIFDGSIFHMWYDGQTGDGHSRIGYATSSDGINWNKYAGNPVIDIGNAGEWNEFTTGFPSVLFDGTTYQMWFVGRSNSSQQLIGYATSNDGIDWTQYINNPVLNTGNTGEWDELEVTQPTVIKIGSIYHMWYEGNSNTIERIGYTSSTDGINWTKGDNNPVLNLGSAGSWDEVHVWGPAALNDGNSIRVWYCAGGKIGEAHF